MFGIAKPITANMTLPMLCRCTLKICLLLVGFLGIESMEDNILSYKSSVLGSLNSGQQVTGRVFSSSCHNYFINVTSVGYNLVVDLDSSSTKLFLLVKASPILRHSLEDEHNYASYYQVPINIAVALGLHSCCSFTSRFCSCFVVPTHFSCSSKNKAITMESW